MPTTKQQKTRKKFKTAVKKYNAYKRKNPNGTKKIQSFIKEAF